MAYAIDDPLVRAAEAADAKRFRPNSAEFEVWCFLSALTLEEATALSMGIEPRLISREIIKRYGLTPHPDFVKTAQDALRLSPRATMCDDRLRHLERACRTGEFENAMQVGDTWEVRPLDLLAWFERQGGRYPWNGLNPLFVRQVRKDHPAPSNTEKKSPHTSPPADTADSSAEKGKVDFSSLGVSEDQRGVAATWETLCSDMSKPLNKRKYSTMKKCREYCEQTHHIRFHDFVKLNSKANITPGLTPWPKGRPRSTK